MLLRLACLTLLCCLMACGSAPPAEAGGMETSVGVTREADRPPPRDPGRVRSGLRVGTVVLEGREGPVEVSVEFAETEAQKDRGLMYRRYMSPSAGMFFVFDQPEVHSFWMLNTYLSLDMIFIDSDLRIVGIVPHTPPLSSDDQGVDSVSQHVLEVHAGFCERNGIEPGTSVLVESAPPDVMERLQ